MISEEDIKRVASLSKLGLTQDEIVMASKNVADILDHFSVIQNIDTTNVPSADENVSESNVTRADEPKSETLASHEDLLTNAPHVEKGKIKVPAVFTDEE